MPAANRYKDAYRVARTTNAIGDFAIVAGVVLAVLLTILGFLLAPQGAKGYGFFGGLLFGAVVGTLFIILGTLIAALGQTLMATLDTAISVSPFLTQEDKAKEMALSEPKRSGW